MAAGVWNRPSGPPAEEQISRRPGRRIVSAGKNLRYDAVRRVAKHKVHEREATSGHRALGELAAWGGLAAVLQFCLVASSDYGVTDETKVPNEKKLGEDPWLEGPIPYRCRNGEVVPRVFAISTVPDVRYCEG
jgi:hypothetical protein